MERTCSLVSWLFFISVLLSATLWGCIGDPDTITYLDNPSLQPDAGGDPGEIPDARDATGGIPDARDATGDISDASDATGDISDTNDASDGDTQDDTPAEDGATCSKDSDCKSESCIHNICKEPSCTDGLQNGEETDQDCGGPHCSACGIDQKCDVDQDCKSTFCHPDEKICKDPSCPDGFQNGEETDIDCGGPGCPACELDQKCSVDDDCESTFCHPDEKICKDPSCTDGFQNGNETDKDCGGDCPPCANRASCETSADCESGACIDKICQKSECSDGAISGNKTDIDCGGPDCAPCADYKSCLKNSDCLSGVCVTKTCQPPSCEDGVKNALETDEDCGGPKCDPCANNLQCSAHRDCQSGFCHPNEKICKDPACNDGFQNGDETDKDCGGSCSRKCSLGKKCQHGQDCQSGVCVANLCTLCDPAATTFGGGSGIISDPYRICSSTQFNNIRQELDAHFRLEDDIDLSSFTNFSPIGTPSSTFSGSLDGNGFTISNLKINRPTINHQGLFGAVTVGGRLSNIILLNVNVRGQDFVGGLVGSSRGLIQNSSTTGTIRGNKNVGGLLGRNNKSKVQRSYSTSQVTGTDATGGLVGLNLGSSGNDSDGYISNSYATGQINGKERAGGLVGNNENGTIFASYATGQVTGTDRAGGLAGINTGKIENSYATGDIEGAEFVGGLAGSNSTGSQIHTSYATGNPKGDKHVGGLVGGALASRVYNSYATGTADGKEHVGGLIGGIFGDKIFYCHAFGKAKSKQATNIGGLIGQRIDGEVTNSYWNQTNCSSTSCNNGVGVALTSLQFKNPDNFEDWCFDPNDWCSDKIWEITSNHPTLHWQD